MTDTTRAAFEAAYKELGEWEGTTPQFEYDDAMDLYVQDPVQLAWWAWETATLAERNRCVQACESEKAISLASAKWAGGVIDQRDYDICAARIRSGK